MKSILLLQQYQSHKSGDIIELDDVTASDVVLNGIGREAKSRDFLVKPQFFGRTVRTRAFRSSRSK